jgi:hypothetical protein
MRMMPLFVAIALCIEPTWLVAQEGVDPSTSVETVVSAGPESDGKAYKLSVKFKNGRQLSIDIPSAEAVKIVDGLSVPAVAGAQKEQIVTVVQGISIQADAQGRAVILLPRGGAGPLTPLAIPIEGADRVLQLLQQKIAEAKANAKH